jgi:hypothetical protein
MKKSRKHEPSIRRPPAFMEYAADLLALEQVKLMTLAERGLLATMRCYIWSNDTLPADPKLMARLLGLEPAEVREALTERVKSFFTPAPGQPDRLVCPELAAQMVRLMDRRQRMKRGTLNSHKARKEQGKAAIGTHGGSGMASELNCTEPKRTALPREADKKDLSHKHQGNGGAPDSSFLAEYELEESKERGTGIHNG